jgi:hypothetical protein
MITAVNERRQQLMKTKIRLLSILLTLAMFLGVMPGMSMTAYAYDGNPYASLVNSETTVTFNGKPWFIIADDSTAVDAGTVTLFAADNSFSFSAFSDNNSADYSNSKIKAYLDSLTAEGGSFAGVKDAIEDTDLPDVNVTGAKLYLLSIDEADHEFITNIVFIGPGLGDWWLRSHGQTPGTVAYVFPLNDGHIVQSGGDVREEYGVMPALRLNLSTVYFLSDSNTFLLRSSRYDVTYKVVGGTWSDGTTADKTEAVQIGAKPASVPTGMKASEGYTDGAWDIDPSTVTITKPTTFTYTFTAKPAETITEDPTETITEDPTTEMVDKKQKNTKISDVKAAKNSLTVTWAKQKAKGIKGYEIQYSTDKKFKKDTKTVVIKKVKTTKTTIKKLKKNKKYFIRIRPYKGSGKNKTYSKWSKVVKATTKKK